MLKISILDMIMFFTSVHLSAKGPKLYFINLIIFQVILLVPKYVFTIMIFQQKDITEDRLTTRIGSLPDACTKSRLVV